MSESLRRFQRYALPAGALKSQRLKAQGLAAFFKSWVDCRVKDVSRAGALVLSKTLLKLGDRVVLELTPHQGQPMLFEGEVVNIGKDFSSDMHKLGIRLSDPVTDSVECRFLETLSETYQESK